MASTPIIRVAQLEDSAIIRTLSHAIWPIVYKDIISSAQIEYMLEWMYNETTIQRQMKNENITYLILEQEEAVGFIAFGPAAGRRFKLHRLYLLPEYHGLGLGKKLVEHMWHILPSDCSGVELQVNKHNPAQHFYAKLGYEREGEAVFDIGRGFVMDDYILFKKR